MHPTKSFMATFVHLRLSETHSYVLGRDTKSGHNCHFPKYSNILHVLEVSTFFQHQTHKVGLPGVISQK